MATSQVQRAGVELLPDADALRHQVEELTALEMSRGLSAAARAHRTELIATIEELAILDGGMATSASAETACLESSVPTLE